MYNILRNEEPELERFENKEEILIARLLMERKDGIKIYELWKVLSADHKSFYADEGVLNYTISNFLTGKNFNITRNPYLGLWVNFTKAGRVKAQEWLKQYEDVKFSKNTMTAIKKLEKQEQLDKIELKRIERLERSNLHNETMRDKKEYESSIEKNNKIHEILSK